MHQNKLVISLAAATNITEIIEPTPEISIRHFSRIADLINNMQTMEPNAFIVDLSLPNEDCSLDAIPTLKSRWPAVPVIAIPPSDDSLGINQALAAGANDFVCKPLNPHELLARLELRMDDANNALRKEILEIGDIKLDIVRRSLKGPKSNLYISPIESTLLSTLINAKESLVEKETLKLRCWGEFKVTDNALHRKLHAVRQALKDVTDCVVIVTKYGVGFSIEAKQQNMTQLKQQSIPLSA